MFCKNCGSQLNDGVKFCPKCGCPTKSNEEPMPKAPPIASDVSNQPKNYSAPTNPTKKRFWKTEKPSGLRAFFIVLLAFILFFTSFVTIFVFNARIAISADGIESALDELPFNNILESAEFENEINEFEKILKEEHNATFSKQNIADFLERSTLRQFIAKKTEAFIKDCLNNKEYSEITLDRLTIYELLVENKELMYREFGIPSLTNNQLYEIADWTFGESTHSIMTSDEIPDDTKKIFDVCLSDSTFIILLSATLLIIFIMLIINLSKGFNSTATVLIIVSSVYLLINFVLAPLAMPLLQDGADTVLSNTISNLINNFFTPSTIISIVLLVVCIGGLIYFKIRKSKAKKTTANTYQ